MTAVEQWKAMIQAEHAQSEALRASAFAGGDHWRDFAANFRADPHRSGDPLLERLRREISPQDTVIDVGAGGGRMALPLALHCRRVVAVEPSPSMCRVLEEQAHKYGIGNVTLVQASWEEAQVDPADIVLCCHVLYTVQNVEPFLRKLESHARQRVLIVLHQESPQSQTYPLWREIHGRERLSLPSLPQLQEVLRELGIDATVEMLPPQLPRGFDSMDHAARDLSRRLYLPAGSPQEARLRELLPHRLVERDGQLYIAGAPPQVPALVWWTPTRG
jgi:SAM-dependent methyltransferase